MNKPLYDFFTKDHYRLTAILDKATVNPKAIDMELYEQFRVGLLTHIKMEEKILFAAAQEANNGIPLPIAAELRLEHGAITTLMVPTPTKELIKVLRFVLEKHDFKEEAPGGMYDACEALTEGRTKELLEELSQVSDVPLHKHNDAPIVMQAAKRALSRAGYDYDEIVAL